MAERVLKKLTVIQAIDSPFMSMNKKKQINKFMK